jgi:uncharacterized protein with FMN-binding domain
MKRRTMRQAVPALIMAGAAAVPVATTAEILTHVPGGGANVALQPGASAAAGPPGTPSAAPASASAGGTRTFQGPVVSDPFGGVQATVTITGKRIADVMISAPMDNPRSAGINQQAVPYLRSETLQAQSAQINTVSGATLTSQAYAQSLQGALDQARSQGSAIAAGSSTSNSATGIPGGTAQAPSITGSADD